MIRNILLVFLVVSCAGGCSASQKAAEHAAITSAIDCSKADILPILSDVAMLIFGGGSGWQDGLESIGKTAGTDVLACAVRAVSVVITAPTPTIKTASDPAAIRAGTFIAAKGWRFVQ